jgi:hypothetical protein
VLTLNPPFIRRLLVLPPINLDEVVIDVWVDVYEGGGEAVLVEPVTDE